MTSRPPPPRHRRAAPTALLVAAAVMAGTSGARADADDKISRLIQLLIQKDILSPKQARELLRETNAPAKSVKPPNAAGEGTEAAAPKGQIRVTYVPQFIRKQIADEVRAEVLTQEQQEGWAAPDALPEWTKRFKLYGDLRVRYERDTFGSRNYNQFLNFAGVNNGPAFDFSNYHAGAGNVADPPLLNTTQNRDRERVRARIGVQALIDDGLTADVRISTGSDQGPVTPNQTIGQPGDFSKYSVYIDRANLAYQPFNDLKAYVGREDNPFFTTDLLFYGELGFDGLAVQYTPRLSDDVGLFLTGGAFPILNTAFDFSTNSSVKFDSSNGYLMAIQGGARWQARPDLAATLGVGFFDFTGIQGAVSQPCVIQAAGAFYCNTDATRFPYQQFGNTVYAIRNIDTSGQGVNPSQPEYFGLASRFAVLEVHPRVEVTSYHPLDLMLEGEFLKNLAYNQAAILKHGPPNFVGPQNNMGSNQKYQGGDTGYVVRATLGDLIIRKRWDWNVSAAYKYVETDATLDSIDDADFHLGGTNAQGYILTGSVGVAKNTFLSLRYFSSQVISGPTYDNDVFQLDLQSTF